MLEITVPITIFVSHLSFTFYWNFAYCLKTKQLEGNYCILYEYTWLRQSKAEWSH